MYHIRPYNEKDRSRIEYICAPEEGPIREASLNCFCRYYIEREPESCFVCADDTDVAQGYILCAKDFSHWAETIDAVYGQRAMTR